MRLPLLVASILACMVVWVVAWSKEDQEIFRLRDEVTEAEGPEVTFYQFLGILPTAKHDEINKAYRKKSRSLHPDKVKQSFIAKKKSTSSKAPSPSEIKAASKAASDRFARLGIVTNILRGPGRERYDYFLSNGFPKWKGTGYYYARFRPGLGSVLAGLFICVGGGGHWIALYLSWKRQKDFVGRYIKFARHAAWGGNLGIPGVDAPAGNALGAQAADELDQAVQPTNRRQRRLQEKDARKEKDKSERKTGSKASNAVPAGTPPQGAVGPKKRVVAENGKILVVDSVGNVYLEQADENGETHEFLLDPNELPEPTIKDTALYRVPIWAYSRYIAKYLAKPQTLGNTPSTEYDGETKEKETANDSSSSDFEIMEKIKTPAQNGVGKMTKRTKKNEKGRQ